MSYVTAHLNIEILTPWHIGSGIEGGAYADSLTNKDAQGLPVLNGKSIKGLLRAACEKSMEYQWVEGLDDTALSQLFGQEGTDLTSQGAIEVTSATLSEGEQAYFSANPEAIALLYRVDYNTAIDHKTGVAKDTSLRSTQSVVPMRLVANLYINGASQADSEYFLNWIETSLPLITALGGKRRRGYGEAVFSLVREEK